MPGNSRTCRPHGSDVIVSVDVEQSNLLRRLWCSSVSRYRGLPPWILLTQLFLAAGWLRAAAAHGIDPEWWSGAVIAGFQLEYRELSVEWYRITIGDGLVATWPVVIAWVVFLAQVLVGLMLALNVRPLAALAVGAFLNINFCLAGAVNPSIFYLIIGAALALWRVDHSVGPMQTQRLIAGSTLIGATALGALLPEIATIDPANVIDDPAMVLSFLVLLWVGALRVDLSAVGDQAHRPKRRGRGDEAVVALTPRPSGGDTWLAMSRDPRCERLR